MAYQPELEKLERRYSEEPAKNFAQLAEAYRRGGRVDEALDLLLMHLVERPNYVSALIVLGRCHLDKDQLGEAAEAFERVLAIDGENIIALKVLGEIAARQGDVARARAWLTRLLEVDPMNEEAAAELAALGPALSVTPEPAAAPEPFELHAALEPSEDMVIERASTEVAPPSAEEAAEPPPQDLDLETAPEPELPVPEKSGKSSSVFRFDEPLWTRNLKDVEVPGAKAEGADAPPAPPAPSAPSAPAPPTEAADESAEPERLDFQPFDSELAWGTGEHMSGEITEGDIEEAEHAHEASVDRPAQELPGLEHAEVPTPEEAHDVAPPEGLLSEELAEAARQVEPLPDLEAGAGGAVRAEEAEGAEEGEAVPASTAPSAPSAPSAPAPVADEFAEADESRGSLAGLPVFMPESDQAADEPRLVGPSSGPTAGVDSTARPPDRPTAGDDEEEDGEEPEPVLTETMAELYARQGLVAEAKDVYRRLLTAHPDDEHLKQRLGELERRRTTTPAADPRARYEAARTGGVAARDFLRAVLEGREISITPAPVEPESLTPMDEVFGDDALEARGAPTRPAPDQPSLAGVFGEEPTPSASPAPSAPPQSGGGGGGGEGGFSFDEFFGEAEAERPAAGEEGWSGGRTTRAAPDEMDESEESFKAWLKGLKS